jgi:lysyl-tRNA synthetase class 1
VKINDWVAEHVLDYPPPYHARYELFQDKSGRKISKSVGNLVTPDEWLEYASPESLRLLMYKRIIGARSVSLDDIPVYMDDFDDLEEYYFSKKRDANRLKDARLRGLYEYAELLKVPKQKEAHVPYRLLAQLASVAPQAAAEEFVVKRLATYGMAQGDSGISDRILWASKWAKRGGERESELPPMSRAVRTAVDQFARALTKAKDAESIQNAAFDAVKANGLKPGEFFPAVYGILLGSDRGPRLGPYVMDAGHEHVSRRLLSAVSR